MNFTQSRRHLTSANVFFLFAQIQTGTGGTVRSSPNRLRLNQRPNKTTALDTKVPVPVLNAALFIKSCHVEILPACLLSSTLALSLQLTEQLIHQPSVKRALLLLLQFKEYTYFTDGRICLIKIAFFLFFFIQLYLSCLLLPWFYLVRKNASKK